MTNLSYRILEKIKEKNVKPKPRWYFMLLHTLLGTAILTSIIIGGISTAIVIRHFIVTDWELARQFSGGHVRSVFLIIPYIWLIFIGLTIFLADLLFKHTKKGHRISPYKIVLLSITLSLITGGLFYFIDVDKPIEDRIRKNIGPYAQWEIMRSQIFATPEKGVLAGEIILIDQNNEWIVLDFRNREWIVDTTNARRPIRAQFNVGMLVGMTGEIIDKNHFKASRIAPWLKEMLPPLPPMMMKIEISERKFKAGS